MNARMPRNVRFRFEPENAAGEGTPPSRLDRVLAARFPSHSRADLTRLIEEGAVFVDGRPSRKGHLLRGGEEIRLTLPDPRSGWTLIPDPESPLHVHYQDAWLVCVEKSAGIPTLPLRPDERGTVANALVAQFPEMNGVGGSLEAGLLHRLDTGTSGLLVAARTWDAHESLRGAWRAGRVTKIYLAIVRGAVRRSGRIDAPLAAHPKTARRVVIARDPASADALAAHTEYEPIRVVGGGETREGGGVLAPGGADSETGARTLLRVRLGEGRRHQIRVHLASIGHPVLGDDLYGAGSGARLALHSHRITLPHPETGQALALESPLPADLAVLLEEGEPGR